MNILDARTKLAAVLAPEFNEDPDVHAVPEDSVTPPCITIGWRAPVMIDWTSSSGPRTVCTGYGTLILTLVGGRLEMAGAIEAIESMYDRVQRRLRADSANGWSLRLDSGIVPATIGNVQYLVCRIEVRVPLQL